MSFDIATSDREYFFRPDGDDANTGTVNSPKGAFQTIQGAYNKIAGSVDFNNYIVRLQLGGSGVRSYSPPSGVDLLITGRWTADGLAPTPWRGGGVLEIIGDATTPSNAVLTATSAHCFRFAGSMTGIAKIRGFDVRAPNGYGIRNGARGDVWYGNMIFGPCVHHVGTEKRESYIRSFAPCTINGDADRCIDADAGFIYQLNPMTIVGNRTFSTFARARNGGYLLSEPNMYPLASGASVSGQRFQVYEHATISTQDDGNANHFPGNAAGNSYPQYGGLYL